ncbi:MAG: tetratricopeptide repeat protein [Candidatus Delongbacteria bacterium]|jgi:tetratricopeptide (TPR) repeat protein|nr:tetratricopeptide repeat protein [Candidatus Delongbacteria bacterium]
MKFIIIIATLFVLISCSVHPEKLEESGNYEKALALYKEMLTEDYQNEDLRIKFTLCYFKNATKYINENDLDEAERNIERGIIYNKVTNPKIKNQYANTILLLGNKLVKIGNLEGSVDLKKKYQKGYELIEKSVLLLDDNSDAKKILNDLNKQLSNKYYEKGNELFFQWQENSRNNKLLNESLKLVESSLVFNTENKNAKNLDNTILEILLFESMKDQELSFRIMKIFHNTQTRISAFKIRFYNDHSQNIIISPEQFTLYDNDDIAYKFDKESSVSRNYTGLLKRKRISPSRFTNGLLVFNTGKKSPNISSLIWRSSDGKSYEKEFPNKKLLNITKP